MSQRKYTKAMIDALASGVNMEVNINGNGGDIVRKTLWMEANNIADSIADINGLAFDRADWLRSAGFRP